MTCRLAAAAVLIAATATLPLSTPAAAATQKQLVVGFSQRRVAGSDWYKTLVAGAVAEGQKLGMKVMVTDAGGDTVRQNSDVQLFLTQNVGGIIVNANDPRGLASSLRAAKRDGVPVVAVNSNLDPSLDRFVACYVAEDQVATGAKAGAAIAAELSQKFKPTDTIKLAVVGGYPGDVLSELRRSGFAQGYQSYFKNHPGPKISMLPIRYGHWLPDGALGPIRDIATSNPDLKVVFSESDVMQAGVEQGLRQAGIWSHILEGTYDGQMNTIKSMIDNPNGPVRADASNQPYDQGVLAMQMLAAAMKGDHSGCAGGTRYVQTVLVTPENAKQYYNPAHSYVQSAP